MALLLLYFVLTFSKHCCFLAAGAAAVRLERFLWERREHRGNARPGRLPPDQGRGGGGRGAPRSRQGLTSGILCLSLLGQCQTRFCPSPPLPCHRGQEQGHVVPSAPRRAEMLRAISRSCSRSLPASVLTLLPTLQILNEAFSLKEACFDSVGGKRGCRCHSQSFVEIDTAWCSLP